MPSVTVTEGVFAFRNGVVTKSVRSNSSVLITTTSLLKSTAVTHVNTHDGNTLDVVRGAIYART